jgi:hypothetical protein
MTKLGVETKDERLLNEELAIFNNCGYGAGWTRLNDERSRQVVAAVAQEATRAGLMKIGTNERLILTRTGTMLTTVILDTMHSNLARFWQINDLVKRKLGQGSERVTDEALLQAVSGALVEVIDGSADEKPVCGYKAVSKKRASLVD